MPASLDDPLIGRLVDGRYQVVERIARGGMATVYEARDLRLDRTVAIKVMHAHLADDAQFRERFIQEAHSAARLAHPNVVNVFDQGEEAGLAYLVMEHVPSITLRDLLIERRRVSPTQSLQVLDAVLSGLSAAHRAGIVHRDLKPENVLLAHDGRIKIVDFGLARAASANTATGKALLGTIAYLSPELVTRGVADARSDIYAVGIMLFEMLTGAQPFTGEQPLQIAYQHAHEQVPAPSSIVPSVPHELDLLVHWATHRDPNLRPADAAELLDEVVRVRQARSTGAQTRVLQHPTSPTSTTRVVAATPPPAPVRRPRDRVSTGDLPELDTGAASTAALALQRKAAARRRRGWVWLALVLVLALAAAATGWWMNLGPGGRSVVPEVAPGTSEAEATATLADAGLVVVDARGEHSVDVPASGLLATEPPAGTILPRGAEIVLVLSLGIEMLPPPDLRGTPASDAEAAVEDAGFSWAGAREVFHDSVADDVVVAGRVDDDEGTDVRSEESWPRGVGMYVVVSAGPRPTLEGLDVATAQASLEAVGLVLGEQTQQESADVAEGVVLAATWPDGVRPRSGDAVAVVVSSGPPRVDIPADILSSNIPNAVERLEALGLEVDLETNVPSVLRDLLQPTGIDPEPGASVVVGSTVTVTADY